MKKFSVVAIGIVFLLAGLYAPVFADSGHGSSAGLDVSANKDALSALNIFVQDHIKETYTTRNNGSDSYNPSAVKYFYTGETIYFVGRVFFNYPGPYTVYTIVTDVGGHAVLIDTWDYNADSSDRVFWFSTNTLTSGTYNCSILVYSSNGYILSPTAFTFVVQ